MQEEAALAAAEQLQAEEAEEEVAT